MVVNTIHGQNIQGINSNTATAKRLIESIQNYVHCRPILLEECFLELNPRLKKNSRTLALTTAFLSPSKIIPAAGNGLLYCQD
jgi:hypothetical protein